MISVFEGIGASGPSLIERIDAAVRRIYAGHEEREVSVVAAELGCTTSQLLDLLCAFSIEEAEKRKAEGGGS